MNRAAVERVVQCYLESMERRRITIDSIGPDVAVTPFAHVGQTGSVVRQRSRRNPHSSVLSRPAEWGPQSGRSIERYTDEIK